MCVCVYCFHDNVQKKKRWMQEKFEVRDEPGKVKANVAAQASRPDP